MGNCLKRSGSNQQDNTTLLTSTNDPTLARGSSQEALTPALLYSERRSFYSPVQITDPRLLPREGVIGRGVGINIEPASANDEEQQVRIAKRIGLIQHLPVQKYDGTKKGECVICMMELAVGEEVRYLPCMHTYHAVCIDDWLLRSLTCPSCMEPVDAALISSYHPST